MNSRYKSEGDINISCMRGRWQAENLDKAMRNLIEKHERHFLRQSLSTPSLNAMRACDSIFIEDKDDY